MQPTFDIWVPGFQTFVTDGVLVHNTNFMGKGKPKLEDDDPSNKVYNTIMRRRKSRFLRGGKLPGLLLMVSSKQTVGAFTEQRIKAAETDAGVFVREYATWDVQPQANFSGRVFHVLVGDEYVSHRILQPHEVEETRKIISVGEREARIIEVPEEYRRDFERDLDSSIRDVAGYATFNVRPFIGDRVKIADAFPPKSTTYKHPFGDFAWVCGSPTSFDWNLIAETHTEQLRGGVVESRWRPKINPNAPRHVHLDISRGKQDPLGMVVVHISRWVDVPRRRDDGTEYLETAPEFWVDIALQVLAPTGGEIILGEVRGLIYDLVSHGFPIASASSDTYQYVDTHQKLIAKGIDCEIISVDKTNDPYDALKEALYEKRVRGYPHPVLAMELRDLEYDPVKNHVDHPRKNSKGGRGTKDVADALAACIYKLSQSAPNRPTGAVFVRENVDEEVDLGNDESWVLGSHRIHTPTLTRDIAPIPIFGGGFDDDE